MKMDPHNTSHDRKFQDSLSQAASFFDLLMVQLAPETFLLNMKRLALLLDCAEESARAKVWTEFANLCLPPNQKVSVTCASFLSQMVESLLQNSRAEARTIELFRMALINAFTNDPGLCQELLRVHSSTCFSAPEDRAFALKIPLASPLYSKSLKMSRGRLTMDDSDSRDHSSGDSMEIATAFPECINEEFLPHPSTSPFGTTLAATFAQLRCLTFWSDTLDSMAPAYKSAVWRIAKVFHQDFGIDHDITNFTATINKWAKEPLRHRESIQLLFSAIGYLKNQGVLSQEFEWPDQQELYPMFHGELTADRERKKLRRKKRRGLASSQLDETQIDLRPLKLIDFERSAPAAAEHKPIYTPGQSAFTPIGKKAFRSRSDSDENPSKRRRSGEFIFVSAHDVPPTFSQFHEPDAMVISQPFPPRDLYNASFPDHTCSFQGIKRRFNPSDVAGSSSAHEHDETSEGGSGLDSKRFGHRHTDSTSISLDKEFEDDVMEVVSALNMIESETK